MKYHERCNARGSRPRKLPTRLIELSPSPLRGAGKDSLRDDQSFVRIQPRLCQGSELPFDTQYFTLSHCWDQLEMMTLTEENLNEMQLHVDISRITKTFREAMEMTVRLGVRYLWIDSLCIIQDSTAGEDWKRESRLMGDVYQNALCNLGATKAKDGKDGLFSERMLFNVRPCVIESNWYYSTYIPVPNKVKISLIPSSKWNKTL